MTTMTSKLIVKRNGFSAFLVNTFDKSIHIEIETPYEDVEENDTFRGEYLAFKNILAQTDLIRKARKDSKLITYKNIYRPE